MAQEGGKSPGTPEVSDRSLVHSGLIWAGILLILASVVGLYGQLNQLWTAPGFLPWVFTAAIGIILIVSRGRILSILRSFEALGTKVDFITDTVRAHEETIQRLTISVTSLITQQVTIPITQTTTILSHPDYQDPSSRSIISPPAEPINAPERLPTARYSPFHRPIYLLPSEHKQ